MAKGNGYPELTNPFLDHIPGAQGIPYPNAPSRFLGSSAVFFPNLSSQGGALPPA